MFFLYLIIGIIFLFVLFVLSEIKIEVNNLNLEIPNKSKNIINNNSKVRVQLYILKVLKLIDIDIINFNKSNKKLSKNIFKTRKKIIIKKVFENNKKTNIEIYSKLKKLDISIKELDLKIYFGLKDAADTAIVSAIFLSILGFAINKKIKNMKKQKYKLVPLYNNNDILILNLDGIFTIKMRNIIIVIFKLIERKRVDKNGGSSYRRTYAYSNE